MMMKKLFPLKLPLRACSGFQLSDAENSSRPVLELHILNAGVDNLKNILRRSKSRINTGYVITCSGYVELLIIAM